MKTYLLFLIFLLSFVVNAQNERHYFEFNIHDTSENRSFKAGQISILNNLIFDFDKASIRPNSDSVLIELAIFLKNQPHLVIEIGNHSDCRGSEHYSTNLPEKRAYAVLNRLIELGISEERLRAKGYGESQPYRHQNKLLTPEYINQFKDDKPKFEQLHQLNRRTEIKIILDDYQPEAIKENTKDNIDTFKVGDVFKMDEVRFELGRKYIQLDYDTSIVNLANYLRKFPHLVVEIGCHSDCRLSDASSTNLSAARAKEIKKRLFELGIDEDRIFAHGYRKSQPTTYQNQLLSCEYISQFKDDRPRQEQLHHLNRRTEVKILRTDYKPIQIQKISINDFDSTWSCQLYNIYFDLGSCVIRNKSEPQLEEIADLMTDNPSWVLQVEYHYTGRQNPRSSIPIAQRRADTIVAHLVQYGVQKDRLIPKGFHEETVMTEVIDLIPTCFGETENNHNCSWLELTVLSKEYVDPKKIKTIKKREEKDETEIKID